MVRRGNKGERILDAAAKVFARRGFYNSKVSDIAREAGVADGTIYLYFKSKDDILISLFEGSMDSLIRTMKEATRLGDAFQKLRAIVETHLHLAETDPDLVEVITVELRQSNKFMREYDNPHFKEYLNLMGQIIEDGQEVGTIRKDVDPGLVMRALFGALDELGVAWTMSRGEPFSLRDAARQVSEIFIRGLMAQPQDSIPS